LFGDAASKFVKAEMKIHQSLHHPNIVRLLETHETP
jgi:serine/threonine protein kinase